MDRGAWRATVRGVTKSWTRLKRLSTGLWVTLPTQMSEEQREEPSGS